jgi:FkbM family methyltransferase
VTERISAERRLLRLFKSLPESSVNCLRFRVPFLLPRWFRMPAQMRVGSRTARLQFLNEDGVAADFITCVMRNSYGLGKRLSGIATIVDVGANFGFFSLAARARYPQAAIHAYEPNPRVQALLRANVAGFGIEVHPQAVGAECREVTLIDDGPSNQARISVHGSEGSACSVRQVNLEAVLERAGGRIDLLKLDCEGAEWEMLQSAAGWESVRYLRFEYHLYGGETADQALRALARLGFTIDRFEKHDQESGLIWAAHT